MYEEKLIRLLRNLKMKVHGILGLSRYEMNRPMVQTEILKCFDVPVFNFSLDFELFWGNAYVNGRDMLVPTRVERARVANRSLHALKDLLVELKMPCTWAVVAKLVNPDAKPTENLFAPPWAKNDWYSYPIHDERENYEALAFIQGLRKYSIFEIASHGFAHIEFTDDSVTADIAREDINFARDILKNYVTSDKVFIYSSNRIKFQDVLVDSGYRIIRGDSPAWNLVSEKKFISTPIGYWISPAMISLNQAKKLVDEGIKNNGFIHPWTHPGDVNYKSNDLDHFYRPLFEHVKSHEKKGNLQIMSFDEIWKRINSKIFA